MAFVRSFDVKAVPTCKSGANQLRRFQFKKSTLASAVSTPVHFNARGVVAKPDFVLCRPAGTVGEITMTVRAHCIGKGQWIAATTWGCTAGHLPFDGSYPHKWGYVSQTRSEAVENAIDTGLRQVDKQLGVLAKTKPWATKIVQLKAWAAEAIRETRKNDETLPLHGVSVIDLCAGGLGGFGMGLASIGAVVDLACEIDPEARRIYQQNVKPRRMHDDLCTMDGTKLVTDILSLGLLCQAFSKAGKRKGFADPVLAPVYEHIKRLLREIRARIVIIECAREFLTQDGGKDAHEMRELLMQQGYRVQHRTLNAAGFGVAQSRERSFIVGTRLDLPVDDLMGYVFPTEKTPTACVADILENDVPATMDASQFVLHAAEPVKRSTTIETVGLMRTVKTGELLDAQGYRLMSTWGLGATLAASSGGRARGGVYLVNGKARGLTPREANRMQGMPEWAAHHPLTTHALKHAGNAVAIPVTRELGRQLGQILGKRG